MPIIIFNNMIFRILRTGTDSESIIGSISSEVERKIAIRVPSVIVRPA